MIKVYKIVEQEISEKEYLVFATSKKQASDFIEGGDALHTHIQGSYEKKWTVSNPLSNEELNKDTIDLPIHFAMYPSDIKGRTEDDYSLGSIDASQIIIGDKDYINPNITIWDSYEYTSFGEKRSYIQPVKDQVKNKAVYAKVNDLSAEPYDINFEFQNRDYINLQVLLKRNCMSFFDRVRQVNQLLTFEKFKEYIKKDKEENDERI